MSRYDDWLEQPYVEQGEYEAELEREEERLRDDMQRKGEAWDEYLAQLEDAADDCDGHRELFISRQARENVEARR